MGLLGDALVCPDCRAPIPGGVCESCGRVFPIVYGVRSLLPQSAPDDTRAFFEGEDEARYGRTTMPPELAQPVEAFLASAPRDAIVVELGSGRCAFAGKHPNLVLADYSLHALQRFGHGERIQLDAQRLPFRDESIDAFFSVAAIEHVPNPELVMEEIDRCLAPEGVALLYPAWFVFPWASRDLERRPYRGLGGRDRVAKALIRVRRHRGFRFLSALPGRVARELRLAHGHPIAFTYRRLEPNLVEYLTSDSDAFTSMDPHACATFFLSRGYAVTEADTVVRRLLMGYVPIEIRKGSGRRLPASAGS